MRVPFTRWRNTILTRFGDREDIGVDQLYTHYFMPEGLPKECVVECLELIEMEYELPAGLFRPEDRLEKLFTPVATKNPLLWLFYRSREGDSESEINYELGKRMRRHGTVESWSYVTKFGDLTFGELIRAWCGLPPKSP